MKIQKYTKMKSNKYKVLIDDEEYQLYDDIIIKYGLIMKSEIDKPSFDEILKDNAALESYYLAIKYITKKLRSEKEIKEYLKKKEFSDKVIENTINKLKSNKILNNEIYLKAYINDQINLTNNGPKKIKKNLITAGISLNEIDEALNKIDYSIWQDKINNYISKKIKTNHTSSSRMLKMKVQNDLINLGYEREEISGILAHYDISDEDVFKNEYEKAKRVLSKKYSGYELDQKIKEKLYRKGFNMYNYKENDYEE